MVRSTVQMLSCAINRPRMPEPGVTALKSAFARGDVKLVAFESTSMAIRESFPGGRGKRLEVVCCRSNGRIVPCRGLAGAGRTASEAAHLFKQAEVQAGIKRRSSDLLQLERKSGGSRARRLAVKEKRRGHCVLEL